MYKTEPALHDSKMTLLQGSDDFGQTLQSQFKEFQQRTRAINGCGNEKNINEEEKKYDRIAKVDPKTHQLIYRTDSKQTHSVFAGH